MRMRLVTGLALMFAASTNLIAQGTPRTEIAAVYTNASAILGPTCHGGGGTLAINMNRWLGFVGDVTVCKEKRRIFTLFGSGSSSEVRGTEFLYLVGPRVSYRRRLTPYAQFLIGGTHVSSSAPTSPDGSAFAMTTGAGVELWITERVGLRMGQAEYLRRRVASSTLTDFRFQTGVTFAFGRR